MRKEDHINHVWYNALVNIMDHGDLVAPRGKVTREFPQATYAMDMRTPVLTVEKRKLSYQFMAAEAFWILTGDNRVSGIAPWNKNIAAFSDDGETFFGAYGPKIIDQLPYVINKLLEDPMSRQAGLTIWRENPTPPETKDVPCTVAIFAAIRDINKVNLSVYMRSSDVWLGLPYDVFNFSMLGHLICCELNAANPPDVEAVYEPGNLYLTAASSHAYEANFSDIEEIIERPGFIFGQEMTPTPELMFTDAGYLLKTLQDLRDTKPGNPLRWWEK